MAHTPIADTLDQKGPFKKNGLLERNLKRLHIL